MRRFRGRIKTANAHFLSFIDGGGVGPADEWLRNFAVHTNLRQREPHTEFLLRLAAGSQIAPGMRFGLRSPTAGFVTAVSGGGVPCLDHIRCPVATDARDNDEHTEIVLEIDESQDPAVITVQTDGGYFLSWNETASADALGPVALGVDRMGTNETFVFEGQEDFGGRNWSRRFPGRVLSGVLMGDRIWIIADSLYEIDPFTGDTRAANPVGIGATQLFPCGDRLALLSDDKIQLLEPVSGSVQEVKSPLLRRITGPQSAEESLLLVDRDAGEILQVLPDHTVAQAASRRTELNTGGDFWTPASVGALRGNLYIASGLAINSAVRLDVVSARSHQLICKFEYFDRFDPVVMTDGLSLALGMRECSDPNNAEFLVFRPDLASILIKHHISAPIQDFSEAVSKPTRKDLKQESSSESRRLTPTSWSFSPCGPARPDRAMTVTICATAVT